LLLRLVFLVRAFTTYWGGDLPHSGVEVAFGRDRDLESLVGLLLAALVSHNCLGDRRSERLDFELRGGCARHNFRHIASRGRI
jgi:hypothetical protein